MENQNNVTTVNAPDIVCGGCAGAIKNAFGKVEGVSDVEVNVETKDVTIKHDAAVTREKIVETLDRAGFPTN